ncbi:MAG TPA: hypothetical protein VGL48_09700 [Acidimicrobiales bacterium]|jgi:hypothetical protein
MPVNWYAALILIVLLGIGSVALARYHYTKTAPAVQPTVGQTWHAALAFDICGKMEPSIAATPSGATTGLTAASDGVLVIAPKTTGEAGNNATLGRFASGYSGMKLTNTSVQYPGSGVPLYKNGEKCPSGTPDAGKKGVVRVRSWTLSTSTSGNETKQVGGHYAALPAKLKFLNSQLITVGFVPSNSALPKVSAATVLALVGTVEGTATTTTATTAPSAPTTTVPGATTTTAAGSSTTTAPTTTTSQPAGTTTTTKPASSTTTTKPKS